MRDLTRLACLLHDARVLARPNSGLIEGCSVADVGQLLAQHRQRRRVHVLKGAERGLPRLGGEISACSSMRAFYWAHEKNLFDGTAPDRTVYFKYIHDYNGPGTYVPPVPYEV